MLKLRKIAVTGPLSSGKSSVCGFLKRRGCYVCDSDAIVHEILETNLKIKQSIIDQFGDTVLSKGKIDRKKVADLVFTQREKLTLLEELIHPAVLHEIKRQYNLIKETNQYLFFVAEIPLFKSEFQSFFDIVITLKAEPFQCLKRFMDKTHQKEEAFSARMKNQTSYPIKEELISFTLTNNGSLEDLENQVSDTLNVLLKGASC